ncbi:CHAPERONE DNAJ-DOMAIN SUPERFAMILY PROTEIN-RELATED [Salix koriyanagi]|uniref:CHAPERONE DNAJ-DOMAIN SUPERFAMILY PROTEIN-RELATED n=1 Tax=Salix koriyanagi TaxID=2511006 RepID=A0A9Q0X6E0_9ROSI|nr:CHAPERONE DNAJ-DOMAIN SUPERFAMILY PROTEIN-RELATED [Salix koriyanagi]
MQSSFYDILQNGILKLKIYIVVSTLNQVWSVPLTNANGWSSKDIRFGESHRSNNYSRRSNRLNAKEVLLCNISSYVDHLFQSWHDGFDQEDPSSSSGPSWFRQQYTKRSRRGMNDNQRTTSSSKKGFHFCEEDDDVDVDNIFRSTFGGNRYFHWSFVNDENPQWKNSSGYYSYSFGKNQRYRVEDEYDCSSESDHNGSESNFASDRLALGLRAYGPLKLEDVKNAYRSCALKWHPDRHQGSSKAVAEEKFKLCSAAYQSLCDKLTAA